MRVRSVVLFALVASSGCWTSSTPREPLAATLSPEPSPAPRTAIRPRPRPCTTAIDHAVEVSREELERVTSVRQQVEAIRSAAIESCEEMHWSDEALDCFANAADGNEIGGCQAKLTSDQSMDLNTRMLGVMSAVTP